LPKEGCHFLLSSVQPWIASGDGSPLKTHSSAFVAKVGVIIGLPNFDPQMPWSKRQNLAKPGNFKPRHRNMKVPLRQNVK